MFYPKFPSVSPLLWMEHPCLPQLGSWWTMMVMAADLELQQYFNASNQLMNLSGSSILRPKFMKQLDAQVPVSLLRTAVCSTQEPLPMSHTPPPLPPKNIITNYQSLKKWLRKMLFASIVRKCKIKWGWMIFLNTHGKIVSSPSERPGYDLSANVPVFP